MGRPTNAALRERIAELEAELDDHIVRLESELQDAWAIIKACADSPEWCQLCQ